MNKNCKISSLGVNRILVKACDDDESKRVYSSEKIVTLVNDAAF